MCHPFLLSGYPSTTPTVSFPNGGHYRGALYTAMCILDSLPIKLYGFLTPPIILQEVGVVEMHLGILRHSP